MTLMMILTTLLVMASTSMMLSITPLAMGISILMMALILAIMYSSLMSSWIAFLIFLIYISGMLVMFAYFVALTPNQKTKPLNVIIPMLISLSMIMFSMIMLNVTPYMAPFSKTSMNMFYLKHNILLLVMLALILLFTMIVVVKLVTSSKGPLRPFYKYV